MNIEQIKLVSERYYQLYLQGQTEKYALMEKKNNNKFQPPPLHPTEGRGQGGDNEDTLDGKTFDGIGETVK